MKKAAAYIRVSTDEQAEYSPKSQLEKIREYALRNNYSVLEDMVFVDEGISGRKTENRDAFNRMIMAAKTRKFDAILVWKFSRFARNREDSIVYKSMLKRELGIRVISVSEDVGDDKMSVLFESMIEAMDEYYSLNLAEEVRRGMTERVKRGGACAAAPFGYVMRDKSLFVVEDEAEIVREVFLSYLNGESCASIARQLNKRGVMTHRGNKIESRTVEYWLNNPVYIGKVRWNPCGKTMRYHWNDRNLIIADGVQKAIVERELWDRVQMRLTMKKHTERKKYECKNPTSWLVGLLKCGVCGGCMINRGGYFYCLNKTKGVCDGNGGVSVKKIEAEILRLIQTFGRTRNIEIIENNASKDCEMRLLKAKKKLVRIKEAYENGIDTISEYRSNKEKVLVEIGDIEKEMGSEECKIDARSIFDILNSDCIDNEKKSHAARCAFSRIEKMNKDEYDVFLNFRCKEDQTEN